MWIKATTKKKPQNRTISAIMLISIRTFLFKTSPIPPHFPFSFFLKKWLMLNQWVSIRVIQNDGAKKKKWIKIMQPCSDTCSFSISITPVRSLPECVVRSKHSCLRRAEGWMVRRGVGGWSSVNWVWHLRPALPVKLKKKCEPFCGSQAVSIKLDKKEINIEESTVDV